MVTRRYLLGGEYPSEEFVQASLEKYFFRQNTIFIITPQNIRSFIYLELSPVSTPFYVDNVENF